MFEYREMQYLLKELHSIKICLSESYCDSGKGINKAKEEINFINSIEMKLIENMMLSATM